MLPGSAETYLEDLQKRIYGALGLPLPHSSKFSEFSDDFAREFYDKQGGSSIFGSYDSYRQTVIAQHEKAHALVPSRFEEPMWYLLIAGFIKQIEDVMPLMDLSLTSRPIFGTLPTGRVNAMALSVPGSGTHVVAFEQGLFGFANLMSKVVAGAFPMEEQDGRFRFSTADDAWYQQIERNPELLERFVDVLLAYLIAGHPHAARPYLPGLAYSSLASILRDGMELFVLGHEVAHLACGHLSAGISKSVVIGGTEAKAVSLAWEQEFEADTRGLEMMLAAMMKSGYDLSLSYCGGDLFFGCIDVVEQTIDLLKGRPIGQRFSRTHPPTKLRRQVLRDTLLRSAGEYKAQVEAALQLSGIVEGILARMWELSRPVFERARLAGLELAPAWRAA